MIIGRCNICRQWAQGIKRGLVTVLQLFIHILFNHLHGYMARPLDHDLHIMLPSFLGQLAERFQFRKLSPIVSISKTTRTQAITQ